MRRKWLAILALGWALPAAAQDAEAPDLGAMTDEQLHERAREIGMEGLRAPCHTSLPVYVELARRHPDYARQVSAYLTLEAMCAYQQGRHQEGLRSLKEAERLNPPAWYNSLGLYLANHVGDGAESLERLRRLAQAGELHLIHRDTVSYALQASGRDGHEAEADAFAYDLSATTEFGRLDPQLQGWLATRALSHAAGLGELSRVDALLAHVRSPYVAIDLLALREFEPVWPQVERLAGDNLAELSRDYAAWTAGRLADEPEDRDRLAEHSYALLFAGRFEEAVALANDWLEGPDNADALEEGDAWALNTQVYALDALGRHGEADAVFDRLATFAADENPWVVNFVINRLVRLVGMGRWQEGAAASEIAREVTDRYGSPYAEMLVAGYSACAFHQLGRSADAARELEFVRANFRDSPPTAGMALLCAGRDDEAADLLGQALHDETVRRQVLDSLQDEKFDLFWTPSVLRSPRDLVMARDDLREEVMKHVRPIPDRFAPIAYLRRRQAVPASETGF